MFKRPSLATFKRKRGAGYRCSLEALEGRMMLASSSGLLSGHVYADGAAWANAQVTLYEAGKVSATQIGTAQTDSTGRYQFQFDAPADGTTVYVLASAGDPSTSQVVLASVAGEAGVNLQQTADVNELTTVATAYALSQFIHGEQIFGPSPGFDNAVGTVFNLVDVVDGQPGAVISDNNNGADPGVNPASTLALQTQNTLANMLAACSANSSNCGQLFTLTTINGQAPSNTFQAIHNIAQNPHGLDNSALLTLANVDPIYTPNLGTLPTDWVWVLALHYTDGGFNAPGRIAFDAQGNLWSNNNFMPPAGNPLNNPGKQVTALNPQGQPILASPIYAQSVSGSAYGTAVDSYGNVWISNFDDGGITEFSPDGKVLMSAPASETGLNHPMGMLFDQQGNLWIPNMGDPSNVLDNGSVTVFLHGDPTQRRTYTHSLLGPLVGLVRKPFSLAIDGQGRAWVANGAGPSPSGSVTVLQLTSDNQIEFVQQINSAALSAPIETNELRPFGPLVSTRTIAIDSNGNAWVNNFDAAKVTFIDGATFAATDYAVDPSSHGWGLAVDGKDVVWAASFTNPVASGNLQKPPYISVVQGAAANRGDLLYSFSNPSLQHITALQLDASGNVWATNNWSLSTTVSPLKIYGGDGVVEFVGMAAPVATPLIGPPAKPGAANDIYVVGTGAASVTAENGVLANDTSPSAMTVTTGTVVGANGGTFVFQTNGAFVYTPSADFPGFDYASYTATDIRGDAASATVYVLSQPAGLVWKTYELQLHRNPDPAGLAYWTNDLLQGGNSGDVAAGLFESNEGVSDTITSYYQQFLLRAPDAAGLAHWEEVWRLTGTPERVEAGLVGSSEFYASAGGTAQGFVSAMYVRILDRPADPQGEQYWLNYLASFGNSDTATEQTAWAFFNTLETYQSDVTGWFQEFLQRSPTEIELNLYAQDMLAGSSDLEIVQAITNLTEFAQNPPAAAPGVGDPLPDYLA